MNNGDLKKMQYQIALKKYHSSAIYIRFEIIAAIVILTLQIFLIVFLFIHPTKITLLNTLPTLFFAYVTTDFINGLAHMIIDNSENYTSVVGPFVAAFKLHHVKLNYKNNHPLKIYFFESSHKIWLLFYMVILCVAQLTLQINFTINLFFVSIGIFSSVSEVSHYWCHNGTQSKLIRLLQKCRILLSMKHHKIHHRHDNTHYAFLNGMTDPVLNVIAKRFFRGYKHYSDKHATF